MTVNAFAKDILGKPRNLNCFSFYLFSWEEGARGRDEELSRHIPLLTLCPRNLALPSNEGERKHRWGAALGANRRHGAAERAAGCGTKGRGRCGVWPSPPAPSRRASLPPPPPSCLCKSFGPFPSLCVVSLSILLLLQALFGGFAPLLAFSSPGTFKCEMAGIFKRFQHFAFPSFFPLPLDYHILHQRVCKSFKSLFC